jgi:hypothetical protein
VSEYPPGTPPTYASDDRTPAQIESDLAATRDRLSVTVDSLVDTVNPRNVVRRFGRSVKARINQEVENLHVKKIATVAGGAVVAVSVVVGLRILIRKR